MSTHALTPLDLKPPAPSVELRYVARAGLLPELSRQTYDSLCKALREAVLNSMDAGATRVDIDFSRANADLELIVSDDGGGMSLSGFCDRFMSLGGSTKFGAPDQFGRIGIGSLALLQYATCATIETKYAGSDSMTVARIEHPWSFDLHQRRTDLADMPAGLADEVAYAGSPDDHFTRVCLQGVSDAVVEVGRDPAAFYRLLDDLRRVLPLSWGESRVADSLSHYSPDVADLLRDHMRKWSIPIYVTSTWDRPICLTRRSYGDDPAGTEDWTGKVHPIFKRLRVPGERSRQITVAGFLLSQKRAFTAWSGITARVQNVAVEERTFFDVTSDPGFRKYVTGEVFLLGDLDRPRLINIDRASFNRECTDYRVAQRFMSTEIISFKSKSVQQPQRRKVEVRQLIEQHRDALGRIADIAAHTERSERASGRRGLPSSRNGRLSGPPRYLPDALSALGAHVEQTTQAGSAGYRIEGRADDERVHVHLDQTLIAPRIRVLDADYAIRFVDGGPTSPPVLIRNRPREIVFNRSNPANVDSRGRGKWHLSLALEIAYLLADESEPSDLYGRMLAFVAAV